MFEGITGHQKQIELLTKAHLSNKLAHAYVFAGPSGVGKKLVARRLAMELLGEEKMDNYFHPDLLQINGEEGIKIEQIRELTYKLSLKPYQAKNKVAIIDAAEQMTIEAANALLKVLEEPKRYNYIFLITSNAYKLPKTILSRCQKITFGMIRKSEESDRSEGVEKFFEIFNSKDVAGKLIAAYEIADLETLEIKQMLETWSLKLEAVLLESPSKNLAQKIQQVTNSRKYLEQNVNSKLLLTNLMLST